MHHFFGHGTSQVGTGFHQATQVTIGKDALYVTVIAHHGRGAQAFFAHLTHQLAKTGAGPDARDILTRAHHIAHMREQFATKRTTRMGPREVFCLEAACIQQSHRQCVTQSQLCGGTGRWGQVQGTCFFFNAAIQQDVSVPGQRGFGIAGHGNYGHLQTFEHRQNANQLLGFAAVGNSQHHVYRLDHAQVTMAGLSGVDKHCWRSGGGQSCSHFAADVTTFTHPHNYHTAPDFEHQVHCLHKRRTNVSLEAQNGIGFDVQRFPRQTNHLFSPSRRVLTCLFNHQLIL